MNKLTMNALTDQDIRLIVYALEVYNVYQEWHPISKAEILMVMNKVKEAQLNN